jgi:hypothetical protein
VFYLNLPERKAIGPYKFPCRLLYASLDGRQPKCFGNWKTTSLFFSKMEHDLNVYKNGRGPHFFGNGRQPQSLANGR